MKLIKLAAGAVIAVALFAPTAGAQEKSKDHSGHEAMQAPADVKQAEAKAKINSVDAGSGNVNLTHEPVPALGWPTMTMDLPATRRVDLSTVKPGDEVTITLKKGRDNRFRIIGITPTE